MQSQILSTPFQQAWVQQGATADREQRISRARVSHTVAVRQALSAMCRQDAGAARRMLETVWSRGDELMQLPG